MTFRQLGAPHKLNDELFHGVRHGLLLTCPAIFLRESCGSTMRERQKLSLPNGLLAPLQAKLPRFEPWLGSLCYVLEQDTFLSHCLALPRCRDGMLTGHDSYARGASNLTII